MAALAGRVDALCCANIRGALPFAVAEAYREWRDLSEEEAAGLLADCATGREQGR